LILLRNRNFSKLNYSGSPFELKALISREMWREGFDPERKPTGEGADETTRKIRAVNSHCSLPIGKARARPFLTKFGERTSKASRPNRIEESGFPTELC
jgi:hypothetical protein